MDKNQYDVIVVGSGISGMTAGIIAAKQGEKVLVLEQHSVPGGLMQTYKRKGLIFPTGVHRLGSLNQGQPLWYYFSYLDILDRLNLVKLDDDCFEKIYFPGKVYKIPMGHDRYKERLHQYFPDDTKAINSYFSDLKKIISNIGMYDPSVRPNKDLSMQYTGSMDDYLTSINASSRLKSLLFANNPLYGIPSKDCTMLTHFIISDCYLNSSFRIDEDKTPLATALVDSFTSHGGKLITNALVKKLITKDGTAIGVILSNKPESSQEKIFSKKVIYSGHPGMILDICPPELFRPAYRKRLENAQDSFGVFGVALKFKNQYCPVKNNDAFVYDSWDIDSHYYRKNILEDDKAGVVFLSALPHSSDQDYSVTALTGVSDKENLILTQYYKESKEDKYKKAKDMISKKMMDNLRTAFPDILDHAQIVDTYSPVTFSRYTLTKNGSAYGIIKTANRFLESMFQPATRIKNFFLTGQSISFSGIHGSIVSSIDLCSTLYGKDYLMNKIVK
ncbi:MAG: NAD(P)/FAD-dependent oxidoreductase [Pseudomonadota bacterium]